MDYEYIDEDKAYNLYDEMLDDCNPEVFGISPSRILKECDPIMYRCGFNDWLDAAELTIDKDDE